jgi:hypothetical protein
MPFQPEKFDRLLDPLGRQRMGTRVEWERSHSCSCRNLTAGSPAPGCTFCWGVGVCWDPGVELYLGVTSFNAERQWKEFGQLVAGSAQITIPVNHRVGNGFQRCPAYDLIGPFDRFVLVSSTERRDLHLRKDEDDNHLQARIAQVLDLRISNAANPDVSFVEGVDYAIDGYRVRWMGGPIKGTRYVLEVLAHPVMTVFKGIPMHRNRGDVELPKKVSVVPAFDQPRRIGAGSGP